MEWEITIHNDFNYVELVTKGIADNDSSLEMAKAITETMRSHKFTKVLIDHSNITGVSGKVMEVYERPGLFKIIGVLLGIKIAEIINPTHKEHFRFLETVCTNRGFKFSVFNDRTIALEWLLA